MDTYTKPYQSYDFADIMAGLTAYLKTQTRFKDYDFTGSGMREVMRLLAYDTQQRAFQLNFVSAELGLFTAQKRENAVQIANTIGFTNTGPTAGRMTATITVYARELPTEPTLILQKSTRFFSTVDGEPVFFVPKQDYQTTINADMAWVFQDVELIQGVWVYSAFTADSNNAIEAFELPNENVDMATIGVQVRPNDSASTYEVFNRFESGFDLGADSKLFFVRESLSGKTIIEFGDGKVSRNLIKNNLVIAEYIVTKGAASNGIQRIGASGGVGGYFDVEAQVTQKAWGGSDAKDIDAIRMLAPIHFASQGAAVTPRDYVGVVRGAFPSAHDVIAWGGENNSPPKPGVVFVSAVFACQDGLTTQQKTNIAATLKRHNVGSVGVEVVDASYLYLDTTTTVRYNPNQTTLENSGIVEKVAAFVRKYSAQDLERFSTRFDKSVFVAFINQIDRSIRGNTTSIRFRRTAPIYLNTVFGYSFTFPSIAPGTVLIDGFPMPTPSGIGVATPSIQDDGIGGLYIMWRRSDTNSTIKGQRVGQVDYAKKKVDFSILSTGAGATAITITCTPTDDDESFVTQAREIVKVGTITTNTQAVYE